jgi:hypothetical protein
MRHLEMLFNVCGTLGPVVLHGNWKAMGVLGLGT